MNKNSVIIIILIILQHHIYSQSKFEKGFIINSNNDKINCLINNHNWKYPPDKIDYKISKESEIITIFQKDLEKIQIGNYIKYIKKEVKIDKCNNSINNLSFERKPNYSKEIVLLKVLIEGKASLFSYTNSGCTKYFYSIENDSIKPLVYKKYKSHNKNTDYNGKETNQPTYASFIVKENDEFKQQLWNDLNCDALPPSKLKYINYKKKDLTNYFKIYNEFYKAEYNDFEESRRNHNPLKNRINLNLILRNYFSNLTIENSQTDPFDTNFGKQNKFSVGIEFEYILPFNNNKWALTIEPNYNSYQSERKNTYYNHVHVVPYTVSVDYKSIEVPFTARHYMFLSEDIKFFINASIIKDFSFSESIKFIKDDNQRTIGQELHLKSRRLNLAFGAGFKIKNKLIFETRIQTPRNIFRNPGYWSSDYSKFSLILGYSIL